MHCRGELDGARERQACVCGKSVAHARLQVGRIEAYIHKHVEAWNAGGIHGHQAGVAVVDEEVCAQRDCAQVVHAAGAVGDVAEHHTVLHARKARRDE